MLQKFYEKNRDLIVNIGGKLVHRDEAGVSPFDSTVQNGDGVWEGLRLYQGKIFKLEEHLDRLNRSAAALRYQGVPTNEEIIHQLRRTLEANGMFDNVHIRLTMSRGLKYTSGLDPRINTAGCTLIILAEHKPPVYDKSGVTLTVSSLRRPPKNVLDQHIHSCNQLTSILAKLEANERGFDDALMLDLAGNLAETNATHVFIVKDGTVLTSTTEACPEGITRQTVLDICAKNNVPFDVRDLPLAEVLAADEVFCTGTMGELAPVTKIDDTRYHNETCGPVTERLSALYSELTRNEGFQIVEAAL
ncbi:aminotransferase class IV [Pontiella sp.]|uniref:aminotransferase class IV n=1 Tax=Pontiella sp. TaxID=2837462 RepID=UPI0035692518